jgi:hypothetical protein
VRSVRGVRVPNTFLRLNVGASGSFHRGVTAQHGHCRTRSFTETKTVTPLVRRRGGGKGAFSGMSNRSVSLCQR